MADLMNIPTMTDDMARKVLDACSSPVCFLYLMADDAASARMLRAVQQVGEEHDDLIVFAKVYADENPGAAAWFALERFPAIVLVRNRVVLRKQQGELLPSEISTLLERARQG